tara:strand:- start:1018 stop:1329 length:312 start_codon:yes stop_codon:yes gene_type:complete
MVIEKDIIEEKDLDLENPELKEEVKPDSVIKDFLVSYTGEKLQPENNEITVGMIVETVGDEFPEFLMAVAEENFIRGYHQAIHDVDEGRKVLEKQESAEKDEE